MGMASSLKLADMSGFVSAQGYSVLVLCLILLVVYYAYYYADTPCTPVNCCMPYLQGAMCLDGSPPGYYLRTGEII